MKEVYFILYFEGILTSLESKLYESVERNHSFHEEYAGGLDH